MPCFSVLLLALAEAGIAVAQIKSRSIIRSSPSSPEPCAIVSRSSSVFYAATPTPTTTFRVPADIAYACQLSAPFSQNLSAALIEYIIPYINFESDLAYLTNPPAGYPFPAVDILGGLQDIRQAASAGTYTSQYEFDAAIFDLVLSAHNGHFVYAPGLVAAFEYSNEAPLVSISVDGLTLPDVYVGTDLLLQLNNSNFVPSPVVSINGVDVAAYIGHVQGNGQLGAELSFQDHDAEYNSMFYSLRNIASGTAGYFANAGVVTAPVANYSLEFQNGSFLNVPNFATPAVSFHNISNGEELFATVELKKVISNSSDIATAPINLSNGYPAPVIKHSQGFVAGYFLNTTDLTDTAVLALLTFEPGTDEYTQEYQSVIQKFLALATAAGKTKLVVDLSGNPGGDPYVAVDAFKQLFPQTDPYHATRLRATDEIDFLGSRLARVPYTESNYAIINYQSFETSNGTSFPSWNSLFGPYPIYGDKFTSLLQLNFSDPIQTVDEDGIVVTGYLNRSQGFTQPFTSDNIVLLYDGNCASACAHFSEMMTVQSNVSSIVFGGRPQYGPMAGVGAVKGFDTIDFSEIQALTYYGLQIAKAFNVTVPGNLTLPSLADIPLTPALARVNSGNIIRRGDFTNTPTQYLFDAADCRIFWMAENLVDVTTIWARAAGWRWGNGSCVKGSISNAMTIGNATVSGSTISSSLVPTDTSVNSGGSLDMSLVSVVALVIVLPLLFGFY